MRAAGNFLLLTRVKDTEETGSGLILGKSNDYEVVSVGSACSITNAQIGDLVRVATNSTLEDLGDGIIAVKEYDLVAII